MFIKLILNKSDMERRQLISLFLHLQLLSFVLMPDKSFEQKLIFHLIIFLFVFFVKLITDQIKSEQQILALKNDIVALSNEMQRRLAIVERKIEPLEENLVNPNQVKLKRRQPDVVIRRLKENRRVRQNPTPEGYELQGEMVLIEKDYNYN
jgi:hypothetical protein